MRTILTCLTALMVLVVPALAAPPTMEDAQSVWDQGAWAEAAEMYAAIVEEDPENGVAWFRLGYALHAEGQLERALEAHKRAATFNEFRGIALYNAGCAYALMGEKDKAIEALAKSSLAGFDVAGHVDEDADLESVRNDPRLRQMLEQQRQQRASQSGLSGQIAMGMQMLKQFWAENGPMIMAQARTMAEQAMIKFQQMMAQMQQNRGGQARSMPPAPGAQADRGDDDRVMREDEHEEDDDDEEDERRARRIDVPSLEQARTHLEAERWPDAIRDFRLIVEAYPDNGGAWFALGYALHSNGDLEEAIEIHKKAAEFDQFKGIALYNLACAYALTDRKDKAFAALKNSHEAGFDILRVMEDDSDLDSLRKDRRYETLIAQLREGGF